jgi:hypothetical protein
MFLCSSSVEWTVTLLVRYQKRTTGFVSVRPSGSMKQIDSRGTGFLNIIYWVYYYIAVETDGQKWHTLFLKTRLWPWLLKVTLSLFLICQYSGCYCSRGGGGLLPLGPDGLCPRMYCSSVGRTSTVLEVPTCAARRPTSTTTLEAPSRERGNYGREMAGNFADK